MTADPPLTAEQAATLKRLAEAAYELDAFRPNLTRAEADLRIAMLTAKLKLLGGPPRRLAAFQRYEIARLLGAFVCGLIGLANGRIA
jgi:hypothetical protein